MVWIQIRTGPDLDPKCLQKLSVSDNVAASKERVNNSLASK